MMYRKFLYAGAASATIGLMAGSAMAQIGQQQRPGQASPVNGEEFLQQLEGDWDVKVTIYDMSAFEKGEMTRHGQRPGQQPGQQPGQGQSLQQIQQQLEQSFTRAGVSQQQARTHAQQLANRIVRERPDRQELERMIQQEMTRAGVSQQQAQQEAQRVCGQVLPLIQSRSGAGLDPEDDPTADPIRPGSQGRSPDQGERGVTGQDRSVTGQDRDRTTFGQGGQFKGKGSATRSWKLNENFLEEELTFSIDSEAGENRQQGIQRRNQIGQTQQDVKLRDGDEYEALGLFAFEPGNGELCMVWADNTKSMLHYGIAQYDSAQQSMVFYTIDQDKIALPNASSRPGMRPMPRNTPGGPQQERTPGQQTGQDQLRLDQQGNRIVLRIVNDNEHVVHVYRANGTGSATRVMEVTYTRSGSQNNSQNDGE